MDFHSNLSIGADGVVLRNKHGLSGYSIKEPRKMSYLNNVELYRRQLWRGILRQDTKYPSNLCATKSNFQAKLMKYAKRAGKDYMAMFDRENVTEQDLLIGWAGKKLKAKMREKNRIHLGSKPRKIRRKVFKNMLLYMGLRDTILNHQLMPVGEMLPELLTINELVQINYLRNGKKGSLQLLDGEGKWRTVHFEENKAATQADILLAWSPLKVVKTWRDSSQTEPRPLFRGPRVHPRSPDVGIISESTIETSPSQFSPTYTTLPVEKAE
jgi:hypothetical protein